MRAAAAAAERRRRQRQRTATRISPSAWHSAASIPLSS
jgi:hypothetical protein